MKTFFRSGCSALALAGVLLGTVGHIDINGGSTGTTGDAARLGGGKMHVMVVPGATSDLCKIIKSPACKKR